MENMQVLAATVSVSLICFLLKAVKPGVLAKKPLLESRVNYANKQLYHSVNCARVMRKLYGAQQ